MNIQQFQYILAVAEDRQFELAAKKCFVAQSTLSTMISKFEDEIGIKIFDRKKKPVLITKEGQLVINGIKSILQQIDHLNETVSEIKEEMKGHLRMAIIPTVSPYLIPLFLQKFASDYPALQIEVTEQTTQNIIAQIKSREVDIGIVSLPLNDHDLKEIKLYDEPFLFYDAGTSKKTKAIGENTTFQNLWLLEEGHCMRTQVLKLCELKKNKLNSSLNIKFQAGGMDSLVRIVKATNGTTFIPYLASLDFPATDKKNLHPFESSVPYRTIGLITHPFFVKKKLINHLVKLITGSVEPLLPKYAGKSKQLEPV